ncbi:tripartite tricarboxylate transporter substrate binding protein [Parapusillimonas sp. SGNA-6]|nr:tripartite tricarboxylate transporter substrate binding protein [Parapusillimonas sp. SGNA-6]
MSKATKAQHWVGAVAVLCGAMGFASAALSASAADTYPSKPIKIIVPFAPGGSVDILARTVGEKMQEHWKQPVVIESRPGASTLIGTTALAQAAPDGYTLIVSVSNHTTNPAMHSKMPYNTLKDFQPISLMARTPIVAYANPGFEANNLKELVALAKRKPGTVNFGSAGPGSMTHLTAELMKLKTDTDLQHVVYKGGTPALLDTMAGHIPMTFATVGQALQQYRNKQVKPLGISSEKRYASVPEIPTFKEQGIDVVTTEWYGMLAPAGTPPEIVQKLNAEIRRIVALPGLGDRLTAIELVSSSPQELDSFIRSEMDRWAPLIDQLGLKVN